MSTPGRKNDELDELIESVDIEDFLAFEGIDYRTARGRSGVQLNLRECPRCGGRGWKVYLNAETGLGNCFHGSCVGEPGFNVFSFVYHLHGKNYNDSLNCLKRYAMSVGWRPKMRSKAVDDDESPVALPASQPLPIKGKNLKYLEQRGFTLETAEYFHWRYSHSGKYAYRFRGERIEQDYAKRVIIPIYDLDGELVTFQGRSIEPNPLKKYLFPPGLPGSGRYLYNGFNAVGAKRIVIGEGALDVAAIKQAFDEVPELRNVVPVGSFGKSLSMASSGDGLDQLSAIKRLIAAGLEEITFMWDGEPSAIKAAVEAGLELRKRGVTVRVAILPGCDPNETSPFEVRKAFTQAIELTNFSAVRIMLNLASPLSQP